MDGSARELADRLGSVLETYGTVCSKATDACMPFKRPTPAEAIVRGEAVRYAAVALPIWKNGDQWQLGLMKRTEYPGVHSGQISIPGGEVEAKDANLEATAVREFEEEMGVSLEHVQLVAGLSDRYIPPSRFVVTPFVACLESEPRWEVDPVEVDRVLVMPVDELLRTDALKPTTIEIQPGASMTLPAYQWDEEVIWGATAIVLTEFAHAWKHLLADR
jgi:ADP-ribose pyrophosphatase YjhB (NUDIX family)